MRISAYKAIASAAIAASAYLGNAENAYAQQRQAERAPVEQQALTNRILTKDIDYSTAGGVLLRNNLHNHSLAADGIMKLSDMFKVYAERGDEITYEVTDAKTGIERTLAKMRARGNLTQHDSQSIAELEAMKSGMPYLNPESVRLLQRAIRDGVIDAKQDSLFVDGRFKFEEGRYMFTAKSSTVGQYVGTELPIITRIAAWTPEVHGDPKPVSQTLLEQYAAAARKKEFEDSATAARTTEEARRIARERTTRDSLRDVRSLGKRKTKRWGLEASYDPLNGGLVLGLFENAPTSGLMGLETYVQGYVLKGEDVYSKSSRSVTESEKKLIGPAIYKEKVTEIESTSKEVPIAGAGIGFVARVGDGFDFLFRAGGIMTDQKVEKWGRSTITHTRNDALLENPTVIENAREYDKNFAARLAVSAGFLANIRKDLALGATVNLDGELLGGRLVARYRFK